MTAVRRQWDDPALRQALGAVLKARAGAEDGRRLRRRRITSWLGLR